MPRQAGFLNRPPAAVGRRNGENAKHAAKDLAKLDQDTIAVCPVADKFLFAVVFTVLCMHLQVQAFSWGRSKDVLREHNSNDDEGFYFGIKFYLKQQCILQV